MFAGVSLHYLAWKFYRLGQGRGYNYEHGDLFHSASPCRKLRQPKLAQLKSRERIWKIMKLNGPGRLKLQGKNSWQRAKHARLYSDLLQAL